MSSVTVFSFTPKTKIFYFVITSHVRHGLMQFVIGDAQKLKWFIDCWMGFESTE